MCFVICSKKANIERLMRGRCWGGCKLHVIDQLFQMVCTSSQKNVMKTKIFRVCWDRLLELLN